MNNIQRTNASSCLGEPNASAKRPSMPVPEPRVALSFRVATLEDLPWIDALHKQHGDGLGYWPTKQLEGYIGMGCVLLAEEGSGFSGGTGGRLFTEP